MLCKSFKYLVYFSNSSKALIIVGYYSMETSNKTTITFMENVIIQQGGVKRIHLNK